MNAIDVKLALDGLGASSWRLVGPRVSREWQVGDGDDEPTGAVTAVAWGLEARSREEWVSVATLHVAGEPLGPVINVTWTYGVPWMAAGAALRLKQAGLLPEGAR